MKSAKRPAAPALRVLDLRCDQLREPVGLENPEPRLSWRIDACGRRGARQTAYRIRVGTTPNGAADLWDSGRVASDETIGVRYDGRALESRTRVWWAVEAWDEAGGRALSKPATWEMGLLRAEDWSAKWIGMDLAGGPERGTPAPFVRKRLVLRARPVAARLYVSALGLYEYWLNGKRVGADELAPGWTDYTKRVPYQVHEVSAALRAGANTLGAILGDGWFCGHVCWKGRNVYGDRPWLLAQLEVRYADGATERFVSDESWEGRFGPIVANDLLMGETYDARRELPGWCDAGAEDGAGAVWGPVVSRAEAGPRPCFRLGPPVRVIEEKKAVAAPKRFVDWQTASWVFDFGQNLVGRVRLRVRGAAGATVRLRHAEVLQADGRIYTDNLRSAAQTDFYTLRGDPAGETWEPRFTFHGFRYVELTGLGEGVDADTCTAVVLHSDTPKTGDFACSEPLLNQLWRNIDWGQRCNFVEIPTDCPQRDERLGWTGDAQVFVRTAAWNRDVAAFFHKWARDLADTQKADGSVPPVAPDRGFAGDEGGPAWADAVVICPWAIHERYGDTAILENEYATMARFVAYLEKGPKTRDLIRVHPDQVEWGGFGDWLALDGSGKTEGGTPKDLIGTAFFAHVAGLMAKIATRLGKTRDAVRFGKLAARVKRAFQRRYVTPDGLVAGQTQTSYVLALQFDLLPEGLRAKAAAELVRDIRRRGDRLATGFVGTSYLPFVLTETGHVDVAYRLLFQRKWPSWLYAVTQGATTIWERWDGWTAEKGFQDKGMNSFNHYAYGAIGDWMTCVVAGVAPDPEGPGYQRIVLRPRVPAEGLEHAAASLETRHGRVASAWRKEKGGVWVWEVEVPANTAATAWVPAAEGARVTETGRELEKSAGVRRLRREKDAWVVALAAGVYRFEVRN